MSGFLPAGCFVAGCLAACLGWLPDGIAAHAAPCSLYVLYVLMFITGMAVGCNDRLPEIARSLSPKLLLVPLATVIGTLALSGAAAVAFISQWSVPDCLAVGCGFGYYSLSSILITQLKTAALGEQTAAELGTVALIANVIRELYVLLAAPLMVRFFGPLSPVCAGGATTMDTTLPVIARCAGNEWIFIAVLHAAVVDFSVPFFVGFFCSL